MKLKFHKNAPIQYFIIYSMLLINQSNFFEYCIKSNSIEQFIIIIVLASLSLLIYRNYFINTLFFIIILLAFVIYIRFYKGGVGLDFWNEMALKILITFIAISVDTDCFLTRFVKIVCFFSAVSLLFWLLQFMGINLAKKIFQGYHTTHNIVSYDLSGYRTDRYVLAYGKILYSFNELYDNRNIGIFTEPGIFQSVLNSAIFCLIFFPQLIFINLRKRRTMFIVLSICLISTQSTSGYIGYGAIILGMLLQRNISVDKTEHKKWKRYIIRFLLIGFIFILIDFVVRGNDSLLSVTVLSKLFTDRGQFSLVAKDSTGKYRVASIVMAISAMIQHPLGMGYDAWYQFSSTNSLAGAGGWPFKLGAIIGVIPFIYLLYWLFKPMKYLKGNIIAITVFVFLYFNTSLAQSSAVYPVLIMIPMFLELNHSVNRNNIVESYA